MAALLALLAPVLGLDPDQQGLLILFGCLPPAVLNFMAAEQYNQEPSKVASTVLVGNLASLVFVPLGLSLALRESEKARCPPSSKALPLFSSPRAARGGRASACPNPGARRM